MLFKYIPHAPTFRHAATHIKHKLSHSAITPSDESSIQCIYAASTEASGLSLLLSFLLQGHPFHFQANRGRVFFQTKVAVHANISPKAKSSEAILKFWATGKMLHAAYKKNKKKKKKKTKQLTPEITERAAVLANLKKQIATAKVNAQRAATIKAQEEIEATK